VSQPMRPEPDLSGGSAPPEQPATAVEHISPGMNEREALEQGVCAYLPLVRRVVGRLARRLPANVQRDDLMAAGAFGLVDSLRRNGGDGGASFEGYARTRIRGAVFDELRAQDWLSRRARAAGGVGAFVSFEDVASDDDLGLAASDNPAEALESCVLLRALALAVAQLPERERRVVGRHYYEGARLKDIGAELGVSEPRISQILSRAIARLRGALGGDTPQRESGPARPGSGTSTA
jgi:RNA polymerase sigma factor FliA